MLHYLYNDLPIIKLLNNYSIWTTNNDNNIIIYLFDNKDNTYLYAAELKFNTYIILNHGLIKCLTSLNFSNKIYFKINKYMQNTKFILESMKNPEWDFFEEKILDIKFKYINFDININKILSELFMFLKLHGGDINQISNIIKNIKYKFELSKDQEFFMDEIIQNINNKIFILINIKKTSITSKFKWLNCFNFNKLDNKYLIKYIISKPKNYSALNMSKYLMNKEINNKIKYMKDYK